MSRKRKNKKRVIEVQESTLDVLTEQLIVAQERHLDWLEKWGKLFESLHGVSIPQILSYDTIQVLNDLYLKDVLQQEGSES